MALVADGRVTTLLLRLSNMSRYCEFVMSFAQFLWFTAMKMGSSAGRCSVNVWNLTFVPGLFFCGSFSFCESAEPLAPAAKSLLATKCASCHSGDEAKGKLDVTSRESLLRGGETGPAIVDESFQKSLLWQRVVQDEMPPKHPLPDSEKELIKTWIASGSPWTGGPINPLALSSEHRAGLDWWSLQPLRSVRPPKSRAASKPRRPVDDFVLEKLGQQNLAMSAEAERGVLIRRVTFDLIGLPPTPEDVEQFIHDDSPDAYERLLDRLLASPHYGERWARHWLDVVRFGESNGFERDLPRPNAWHYRDWLIQAFNRDLPYNEFVRWQLAGDLVASNDEDSMKALGFLVAGPHDTVVPVFNTMRATMRQDELEDVVATVGQTFLGLTVNCARCHDHKFDPISTREYYQIASALSGIDHGEREIVPEVITRELEALQTRFEKLNRQLLVQTVPVVGEIRAERTASGTRKPPLNDYVSPIAAWDFKQDLNDHIGQLHLTLVGPAQQTRDGLELRGDSFAKSPSLPFGLAEKTLEVRLKLTSLQQAGGGAMTVQTLDGKVFDSIVFGEQEPGRWIAGSNGFQRTLPFQGQAETSTNSEVTISLVYSAEGTITGYRDGVPYGQPIRKDVAVRFESGDTQILFGLRHGTEVGPRRMLLGTILSARLYDRALSPDDVAISVDTRFIDISEADILSHLSPDQLRDRRAAQSELRQIKLRQTELSQNGKIHIYTAIVTQPSPMKIHRRGSVLSLGEPVAAGGLASVQGPSADFGLRPDAIESHRRRGLANWIADENNPLFLRTMVNRIWHYHFGAGLVESPNDLGFHGGQPSHPELLEWLSNEFRSFSVKRLHRLIVTSSTYRQSSAFNESAAKVDSTNRLLWRQSPRRLEAEEVRDAMLMIAGQLNSQIGGKGYRDQNSYFFKGTQFYDPIDPPGYENQRRTVYRMWARGGRSPFLDTFDCPDPSTITPRRSSTVTPLQALSLMNHSFALRLADRFAERLIDQSPEDVNRQIQVAYRLIYSREPDASEVELSREFVTKRGLSEFCRALWNSSEFLFLD